MANPEIFETEKKPESKLESNFSQNKRLFQSGPVHGKNEKEDDKSVWNQNQSFRAPNI